MQHQLASAGPKSVRRNRRAHRLGKLCRCGLTCLVILCPLLLIGCASPETVADQPSDAPLAAPIASTRDARAPAPVEQAPPAVAASPVEAPVAPVTPPQVPEPTAAPAAETDVYV